MGCIDYPANASVNRKMQHAPLRMCSSSTRLGCPFKKRFGKNLTMYGTLDIQNIMPFGTPDDVRSEVKNLITDCAPGGGFILSPAHHIQSDTSIANIEAFYQAARNFGRYQNK